MRFLILLSVALVLGACATVPRFEAAGDVHALLVSVRDGDKAAFESRIDRPALKNALRARLIEEQARHHGDQSWQAIGAALAGPLYGVLADRLIQPDVLRALAIRFGYDPAKPIPNQLQITSALRLLDPDRVCAFTKKDGPCVLIFRREGQTWKLVEFQAELGKAVGRATRS